MRPPGASSCLMSFDSSRNQSFTALVTRFNLPSSKASRWQNSAPALLTVPPNQAGDVAAKFILIRVPSASTGPLTTRLGTSSSSQSLRPIPTPLSSTPGSVLEYVTLPCAVLQRLWYLICTACSRTRPIVLVIASAS
eukprot:6200199-Pleurochrysis_carterae.AAC.3